MGIKEGERDGGRKECQKKEESRSPSFQNLFLKTKNRRLSSRVPGCRKNIFASLTSSDERKRDFYPTKWRLRMPKQTNLISLLSHPDSAKGKFRLRKNSPLTNSLILLQYIGIKEGRRTGWWKEGMPEKGGK